MNWRLLKEFFAGISLLITSLFTVIILIEVVLNVVGFSYVLKPEMIEFGGPNPVQMKAVHVEDDDLLWVRPSYGKKLEYYEENNPDIVYMGCSCTELGWYERYTKDLIDGKYPQNNLSYA
ncbi:MAG: hypothetical protein ABIH11_05620, partial [Candidatus Altiarchaeota archaeon]